MTFAPSDWISVAIFFVSAVGAVLGARWGGSSEHEDDDKHEDLIELRAYVDRTFMPRPEVRDTIDRILDLLEAFRKDLADARDAATEAAQDRLDRVERNLRDELREVRIRIDALLQSQPPRSPRRA